MELLDLVDEAGQPVGKTEERSIIHAKGLPHRTAHIWIYRRKEQRWQVLLQKRSMNKDSFPGCLDTSSAGHIQAGDEPEPSALRELAEELGIHAKQLHFIGNFRARYEKEFHGHIFRDNEVVFVYALEQDLPPEAFTIQQEELEKVDWYDLEDTMQRIKARDPAYCVPPKGLDTLHAYLEQLK